MARRSYGLFRRSSSLGSLRAALHPMDEPPRIVSKDKLLNTRSSVGPHEGWTFDTAQEVYFGLTKVLM